MQVASYLMYADLRHADGSYQRRSVLNGSHWNIAHNMTHGDKELELYMAEQVSLRDGTLVLTTAKKPVMYGNKVYVL